MVNVSVPKNTSSNVSIVLRDNLGNEVTMPVTFTYKNPNISSISPLGGTKNTNLTITGINLMNTSFVKIQGYSVPFTINSSLLLNASVNASSGNASIVVIDNLGNNASYSDNFIYQNPTLSSFLPLTGTNNTSLTLSGENLSNTSAVLFGSTSVPINSVTGTSVNVSVPDSSGNINIVVRDNLGNNVSTSSNFTYQNPEVLGISPLTGTKNTNLTITGLNLMNTSFVKIQGYSVPFTINSSVSLSATVNASSGNASVVVVDNVGNNTSYFDNFLYINPTKPNVSSFTPIAGAINTSVTLFGSNMSNASYVLFGNSSAPINRITESSINVSVPSNSGNVSIVVLDNVGNNISAPGSFTYQNVILSGISPAFGPKNTRITITGERLTNTSFVKIGGLNASFVVNSSVSVNASTPNTSGNASVVIVDNIGNNIFYSGTFAYQNLNISSVTPIVGTTNTSVTIFGSSLTNTSFVKFGDKNASINRVNASSVNVSAPANSENVSVLLIDNDGNQIYHTSDFIYQNPSIISISPTVGTKNTSIVVTGTNLSNIRAVKIGTKNTSF
jgi:hypothetical protein